MPAENTVSRGLRDVKIATWNDVDDYGTAIDLYGASQFTVTFEVEEDSLRGDDVIIDQYSKIIAATGQLRYGVVNLDALAAMIGGTVGAGADYDELTIGEGNTPYFVVAGRVVSSDGTRDTHMIIWKARINGNVGYEAQEGSYLIPNATFRGVQESEAKGVGLIRNFDGPTTLTIPLATTID